MGFPGSIVTAVHDFYAFDCPENFGFPNVLFNRAFCRKALRTSDAVSVDSKATMSALQRLFPEFAASRVAAVVPCCVNFDSVVPEQPSKIHSIAESSFVLSVAQHRENKNLALLLEAFGSLKAKTTAFQKLQLLIVGAPGPETERITELARRMAPGSVVFVSGLSDQELAWLYRKCRMLVVPSSQEGFCFPAVEGMHFGARIVCSDIPVLREVGSGQCTYFDLKQGQEALCNAMARTLTLPEGSVDYGDALIRFQPEVVALQQINLYRRIRQASNIILTSEDSRQETERITQEQC
jgi:glycosyltransferase involved in cell wall biosynthesis